ncbi:MAG: MBL fold metallo-hydrolase [Gammaproteobacteria bacterium]|nr:MBL fold metallo-hydrolase [Gammaproteobacteria bacterium]
MSRQYLTFPIDTPPPEGQPQEIFPGIYWLRMPLPFSLNHINLWILEDEDGWTLIDTGIGSVACMDIWQQVMQEFTQKKPFHRVIVTHFHPDHVGLAGWLCQVWQVPLYMSRTDYIMGRILAADQSCEAPVTATEFYAAAGLSPAQLDHFKAKYGGYSKLVKPLPEQYQRLQDGHIIEMAGHNWQIIVGTGHAPEHITFFCADLNLYISGDQLLPSISSNVSVWPTEPNGNPLQDWLDSCEKLHHLLPRDVLVLPAHERPFQGAHPRLLELQDDHQQGLSKLLEACQKPKRVVDLFGSLFKRKVDNAVLTFAVGETIAHLNLLLTKGKLQRTTDAHGVHWYQQTQVPPP